MGFVNVRKQDGYDVLAIATLPVGTGTGRFDDSPGIQSDGNAVRLVVASFDFRLQNVPPPR
jgi:hypothetical protein